MSDNFTYFLEDNTTVHRLIKKQYPLLKVKNYGQLTIIQPKNLRIKEYLKYKETRKAKVVIYTSITDNYDNLIQHKYISKDFDYICYTDSEIKNPGIWEIRKIKDSNLDSNRKAKIYKILPHKYLKKYDYSIWIDANIDVLSDKLEKRMTS